MIVSGIPWGSQAEVTCHVEGNVVVLVQGGGSKQTASKHSGCKVQASFNAVRSQI